ncbi:MAG TPA: UDP-N-acetylmuramoyl-L-alanine--D-glutamate ligase [Gemmatimonadales bacterium]|nr:UDP-N-acetylmuramoyl-L-alanine--D-glutamate ligase [Gemmatimonadales bacterium]
MATQRGPDAGGAPASAGPLIPASWRGGEVAVIGLMRSGRASAELLLRHGAAVYGSDAADGPAVRENAAQLRALGAAVDVGRHDLARIARCRAVVASPGVPPDAPALAAARAAGVEVLAELELGARFLPATRLVVVTGTKGKSTTTACIAHLLRAAGLSDAEAAGNIGNPITAFALAPRPPAWLAVEASSFQLHDAPGLAPAVGVLTNLSPDHLDRYGTAEAYYADKALLFRNAGPRSRWVTNGDDEAASRLAAAAAGTREAFSLRERAAAAFYDRKAGWLVVRGTPLVRRSALQLLGDHNVANALAAALAVPPEADRETMARALASFRALPHRLEPVRELDGVLWINDSKATILSAVEVALASVPRTIVLLLGGRPKVDSFAPLRPHLGHVRAVVAYGEAAPAIARDLAGAAPLVRGGEFRDVLEKARGLAKPGDAVLLAPACTSFDMFDNAEQRGREFRAIVEAW